MKLDYILEKGSGKMNEDQVVVREPLFSVFDGASSLDGWSDKNGKTGGLLAVQIVSTEFTNSSGQLTEMIKSANEKLHSAMVRQGIDLTRAANRWGVAMASVRLMPSAFEWAMVGDCAVVIINKDNSYLHVNTYEEHDQETLKLWKELADKGVKKIRQELLDQIIKVREEANEKYGMINGDKAVLKFIRSGNQSLEGVKHILIFTDGLLLGSENPHIQINFGHIVECYLEGGLRKVHEYNYACQKKDPHCWKYLRFKQYDDVAAIALTF